MNIGDRVKFLGVREFWFTDIIKNGETLVVGGFYTISDILVGSSWTKIYLKETGDKAYNLLWFKQI